MKLLTILAFNISVVFVFWALTVVSKSNPGMEQFNVYVCNVLFIIMLILWPTVVLMGALSDKTHD